MIPEQILAKYPNLVALIHLLLQSTLSEISPDLRQQAAQELSSLSTSSDGDTLAGAVAAKDREPSVVFDFGITAYSTLHATEEVRRFIGRTWFYAMARWGSEERNHFLGLTVADPHKVFFALELTAELFQHVDLSAAEAFPWMEKAYSAVSKDLMQRGLWLSLQAFCSRSPAEALSVIEMWMARSPGQQSQNAIAKIIGYTRNAVREQPIVTERFKRIEQRLQLGHTSWRAMWIRSWAESFSFLSEKQALAIRPSDPSGCGEELAAWVHLLAVISINTSDSLEWTVRELFAVASPTLQPEAKYWISMAAAQGILPGGSFASDWQRLLVAIMPISAEHEGIWKLIEHNLVELAAKSPNTLRLVLIDLARCSGKQLSRLLKARKLSYLTSVLTEKGLHRLACSDLCFGPTVSARQLGLLLFAECGVDHLDAARLQNASERELELLLLEAQRTVIDYAALGRLHACLATRVDQLTGDLLFLFYDEVALQGLNTYAYREAIKEHAPRHEYLRLVLLDVNQRLAETAEAAKSPALQMSIPSREAAEVLAAQRMTRDVAKGVKEHSVFLSLIRSIALLYGGQTWRMFMPDGTLGEPSQMHMSSATVEVPRMEVLDFEGMHLRRLQASMRIANMEGNGSARDDQ